MRTQTAVRCLGNLVAKSWLGIHFEPNGLVGGDNELAEVALGYMSEANVSCCNVAIADAIEAPKATQLTRGSIAAPDCPIRFSI